MDSGRGSMSQEWSRSVSADTSRYPSQNTKTVKSHLSLTLMRVKLVFSVNIKSLFPGWLNQVKWSLATFMKEYSSHVLSIDFYLIIRQTLFIFQLSKNICQTVYPPTTMSFNFKFRILSAPYTILMSSLIYSLFKVCWINIKLLKDFLRLWLKSAKSELVFFSPILLHSIIR